MLTQLLHICSKNAKRKRNYIILSHWHLWTAKIQMGTFKKKIKKRNERLFPYIPLNIQNNVVVAASLKFSIISEWNMKDRNPRNSHLWQLQLPIYQLEQRMFSHSFFCFCFVYIKAIIWKSKSHFGNIMIWVVCLFRCSDSVKRIETHKQHCDKNMTRIFMYRLQSIRYFSCNAICR